MDPALIQSIVSGLMLGFIFALIAAGLSLIFGVMGFINFAHGDMLMVGLYTSYWAWALFGLDPLLSAPLTILVTCLLGIMMYKFVVRKVIDGTRIVMIMASFGMMVFLRSSAQFLFTANYRLIRHSIIDGQINILGVTVGFPQVFAGLAAVVSSAILYWILEKTETGRALRAVSENREAAQIMGIDVEKMNTLTWVLGSASVGIAASLLSSYYFVFPDVGSIFGLIAVITVAFGGFGSTNGAFVAGVINGLAFGVGGFVLGTSYKYVYIFIVFLAVALFRPQGLMGTAR